MESESFSTNALFASAVLAQAGYADNIFRSSLISSLPTFSIDSPDDSRKALEDRLSFRGFRVRKFKKETLVNAALAAEFWTGLNIRVISSACFNESGKWNLPEVFFCKGDLSLLASSRAGILNSRKHGITAPDDAWLKTTAELVRQMVREEHAAVTSYGTIHHNVAAFLCRGHATICVCPGVLPWMCADEMKRFASLKSLFDSRKTLFLSPFSPGISPSAKQRMKIRDNVIAAIADILFISEVIPNGNMAEIAEKAGNKIRRCNGLSSLTQPERGTEVDSKNVDSVNVRPKAGRGGLNRFRKHTASASGKQAPTSPPHKDDREPFLTHYTRSCRGPWPGQTVEDYCRSLVTNTRGSGHTAFDTLRRILDEKIIRASGRLTRGGIPSVSFTECDPDEIAGISTWRKGLMRWSFEPYGLRIPLELCKKIGAKPVIYGPSFVFDDLGNDLRYLFQRYSRQGPAWFAEREWRTPEDVVLTPLILEATIVLVWKHEEAELISGEYGLAVKVFGD